MNITNILGYQPTIYIDDGHGENTAGKRTPSMDNGKVIQENRFNKPAAQKFGKNAEQLGFRVVYVAPEDIDTPLKIRTDRSNADFTQQRAKYPNVPKEKLALYISFHYNAYDGKFDTNSGGVEVHYWPTSNEGKELASLILKYLARGTPQSNRGIKGSDFHVLRETSMVAVLIEAGFMDVRKEAALMLSDEFQNEVAMETIKGVCEYYDVPFQLEQEDEPIPTEDTDGCKKDIARLNQKIIELENQLQRVNAENVVLKREKEELEKLKKDYEKFFYQLNLFIKTSKE